MALPEEPLSRAEHFGMNIAGLVADLPPETQDEPRLESIWRYIAEHGGGGASSWNDLEDKPFDTIGSGLTVDADGKISADVQSVNGKTGVVELVPSDLGIGTVFQLKGSKPTVADLPASDNTIGDVWYVVAESVGYIWLNDGTTDRWEQLGLPIDLSNYYTKTQTDAAIAADIAAIPTKAMVVTYDDDTTETFNVLIESTT